MAHTVVTSNGVKSVSGTAGNISASTSAQVVTLDLPTIGTITPGAYTNTNLTVDAKGRVTAIANGTPGAANYVLISSQTAANSSTLDFNSVFSNTYNAYAIFGYGLNGVTNTAYLQCLVGTGGTPTYQTTGYLASSSFVNNSATAGATNATTSIPITGGSAGAVIDSSLSVMSFNANVYFPSYISGYPNIFGNSICAYNNGGNLLAVANFGGYWTTVGAWTSIRFKMSTGNISSGTIAIFGILGV